MTVSETPTPGGSKQRSPLQITLSVWKALFLREATVRLFAKRAGTVWLFAEPLVNIAILMFIFTVIKVRSIGGIDVAVWIMVGMLGFFMFRRTGMITMRAIQMNRPLFNYRQVKPVDAVLVRGVVEGVILLLVAFILLLGAGLIGIEVSPTGPLLALTHIFVLWCLAMGFGLITSVVTELIPELGEVLSLVMMPLFFLSGVIFPVSAVPVPYREWMLYNPIVHSVEGLRLGFASHYQPLSELDLWYPAATALVMIFLGLVLHRRFASRLIAL